MGRYALLVGISNYSIDQSLVPLPRAVLDVEALREVLIDPEIGGFEAVKVLKDREKGAIETAIYELFAKRRPEDLVLFYFSGHGVVDDRDDKFYLTGSATQTNFLPPTAVSSKYIHVEMNGSRSQHQVIILDCCNSGAFPDGMKGSRSVTVKALPKLGGEGRAILTASDSSQYAFEEKGFELSLYTHFLVEGLKTGAADRDEDGQVSVNELHLYAAEKVKSVNDRMTPKFYGFMKEGEPILLAKAAQGDPRLKFRKEVEKTTRESNGIISIFAQCSLELYWQQLGISQLEAEAIISEALRPYQEYAKKLEQYTQALQKETTKKFPFSTVVQIQLQNYENRLGLREEDLQEIKDRIIAPKQAEYEQQLQITQRQEEIERLKQQHPSISTSAISAAEVLKHQQPIMASEIFGQQSQVKISQPEFSFEFIKLQVIEERGFLDIGGKTRIELEKKQGKALYIREDLGNGIFLDLVHIPAGKFMMGSDEFNNPIHEVTVPTFLMGKYTVTNAQWFAVMGTKPSKKYDVKFQGEKQPVVGVSWDDSMEFCERLSNKLGKKIRLPSEAEWEYACRANTTTPFHFGESITTDLVNYSGKYSSGDKQTGEYRQKTIDVGSFSPNAFGLYDMHGNVWEWCSDRWHENYKNAPQNGGSWETDTVYSLRVMRGGSWYDGAFNCSSANRNRVSAVTWGDDIGFRLVVS